MENPNEFEIDPPLKGNRDYLHSTTLYRWLSRHLNENYPEEEVSGVKLMFKGMLRGGVRVVAADPEKTAQAVFFFHVGGQRKSWFLFDVGRPPGEKEPCLESKLEELSKVDLTSRSIAIDAENALGAELIDIVVALNKALHQQVFSEVEGKWLFTEVVSSLLLVGKPWERMSLSIDKCLGTKLTRSLITIDGEKIGHLCFSLKPATA